MQKLLISGLAAAFAVATSATMLMGAAITPAQGPQGLFSIAAQPAQADDENDNGGEHGNKHNKHNENNGNNNNDENNQGDNENGNNGRHRGNRCHNSNNCSNRGNRGGYSTSISGIVENSNGNGSYQFREDNGQVITVVDRNQNLNVGQHYNLNGCLSNGTFTVDCNGSNNGGYNGGGNYQSTLSGYITTVSGNTITINQNLIGGTVSIDASEAINSGRTNGSLHFGRKITAYGYYDSNHNFHAQYIR